MAVQWVAVFGLAALTRITLRELTCHIAGAVGEARRSSGYRLGRDRSLLQCLFGRLLLEGNFLSLGSLGFIGSHSSSSGVSCSAVTTDSSSAHHSGLALGIMHTLVSTSHPSSTPLA